MRNGNRWSEGPQPVATVAAARRAAPTPCRTTTPPWWLRSPHLQIDARFQPVAPQARRRAARALPARSAPRTWSTAATACACRACTAWCPGVEPRGLALLLHGWEGSAESSYMRLTAAQLLARGFDVFRLNFRDHGDSHHLNEGAVPFQPHRRSRARGQRHRAHAAAARHARWSPPAIRSAATSRCALALRAPAAGLPLARVAAVCPVLDPARDDGADGARLARVPALLRAQVARIAAAQARAVPAAARLRRPHARACTCAS